MIDKLDSVSDNMINDPENCKTVTQDSVTFAKVSVGPELQEIDSLLPTNANLGRIHTIIILNI